MSSYLHEHAVRVLLRKELERFRSEAEMARAIGISRSHLNRVMRGEKAAAGKVSDWLGLTAKTLYVRQSK